jgi:hypothetical protein
VNTFGNCALRNDAYSDVVTVRIRTSCFSYLYGFINALVGN